MTIGLDLTSLQSGHRMRGIGYTLINLINATPDVIKQNHKFIFYLYDNSEDPLELLDVKDFNYEVRYIQPIQPGSLTLPGKLNLLMRVINQTASLVNLYKGDPRIKDTRDLDAFLQTDQMISLPRGRKLRKAYIAYDLIPYILEWDYLWDYRTARRHDYSIKAALRCAGSRWAYRFKLNISSRQADTILSISDVTKNDFEKLIPTSRGKIVTVPLGVNPTVRSGKSNPEMHHYVSSSWGYLKRPYKFGNTPFLLFVGGADRRRRLDELVVAFNHLRARGTNVKLVLAGDSMQGPLNISTPETQHALLDSSYLNDIVFLGFVNDEQRDWLYKNALAFVFPSKYEGFGLPVLEAMSYGTPVIAYKNQAVNEVAGDLPYYADGSGGLLEATNKVLRLNTQDKKILSEKNKNQACNFSWHKTAATVFAQLIH